MVNGWMLRWGAAVDSVLSAGWVPHLVVPVLLAGVALAAPAVPAYVRTAVRMPVRMVSGRACIRCCPMPLTSPDTVRTRPVDDRPDASGHIPGGGP